MYFERLDFLNLCNARCKVILKMLLLKWYLLMDIDIFPSLTSYFFLF